MIANATASIEDLTLLVEQEIHVHASLEDTFAALKEDQAQVLFRDAVVGTDGFTQKVIHLRDAFDAGETTACDDEGKQASSHRRLGLGLGFLERVHELIAQIERIAQVFEGARVFTHARYL